MKVITTDTVWLKYATINPQVNAKIFKLPFYSLVFVENHYCGKILNSAIKDKFIKRGES